MTKIEALKKKYCLHCAAYGPKGWHCGMVDDNHDGVTCCLPADAEERFRAERGLDGAQQRFEKPSFGDVLPKKGRKKKRRFR